MSQVSNNPTGAIRTTPVRMDLSQAAEAKGEPLTEKEAVHVATASVVDRSDVTKRETRQHDVAERVEQEVMAKVSPDGRSPDHDSKQAGRRVFVIGSLVALGIGAGIVVFVAGGWIAIAAAAAYVVILVIAGMPVWGAGLMRRHEENEVKTEVVDQMRQRRRRS